MNELILAVVPPLVMVPIVWIVFLVGSRSMDRRLGGRGQLRLLRRALRTGVVPDDAVRERWAAQVAKAVRRGPQTWVGWAIIVVLVAMSAAPLLGDEPLATRGLVSALGINGVLVAAVYLVMVRMQRRFHRQWRRLDALLNGSADAGTGAGIG